MQRTSPAGASRIEARDAAAGRGDRGFTLLELLIVLVIMSMMAVLAVPMLSRTAGQARLKSTVATLASELRQARSDAILRAEVRGVVIDPKTRTFGPVGTPDRNRIADGIAVAVETADIAADANGRPGIRFLPDGRSTGGTIRLGDRDRVFEIEVNWLTGRVRVAEPGDGS